MYKLYIINYQLQILDYSFDLIYIICNIIKVDDYITGYISDSKTIKTYDIIIAFFL